MSTPAEQAARKAALEKRSAERPMDNGTPEQQARLIQIALDARPNMMSIDCWTGKDGSISVSVYDGSGGRNHPPLKRYTIDVDGKWRSRYINLD